MKRQPGADGACMAEPRNGSKLKSLPEDGLYSRFKSGEAADMRPVNPKLPVVDLAKWQDLQICIITG